MFVAVQRKKPEFGRCGPNWCHHHGGKMRVKNFDPQKSRLIIGNNAAKVTIQRASLQCPGVQGWLVKWRIIHSNFHEKGMENACGCVLFQDADLAAAFGLSDKPGQFGAKLIAIYGADTADQGKYIRWEKFLNIPGPGTGDDGDPNVSIHLDDEIKNAVRQILL